MADERRHWLLPVGGGAVVAAVLAVVVNLATDLVPDDWREWPAYPWVASRLPS